MIFDVENWLWKSNFGIFDTFTLHQFAKFNYFIWLQLLIFSQNLSNFVSLTFKTPQLVLPYLQATATSTPPGELQDNGRGKKGCRCGNATPAPGKLTCGGQRCPCYVGSRSCIDCKCKGCRNPHQINGIKVIRPHLQVKSLGTIHILRKVKKF